MGVLAIIVLIAAVCTTAMAEDPNSDEAKEVLTSLEQRMQQRIDIVFSETEIDQVLQVIGKKAGLNIIKSPRVEGFVTAALTDVPLEEALKNILTAHGYGYVVDENIVRVAPLDELGPMAEKLVSRIYRITYADVAVVEATLKKFVSGQGVVAASPASSNIIVTDTESKIKAIDTFIEEIDRITEQILVEVRIYDITSRDTLDLGIEWQAGRRTTIASPLGSNPTGDSEPYTIGTFSADTAKTASTFDGNLRLGWLTGDVDIDMILHAQKEKADAKLLANPRIMVLDNESAIFDIVTEIPYAEASFTSTTVTETIKFKEVGVKLEVVPHVTRDGMIRLQVAPVFSVVLREESFSTSDVPVVDRRTMSTITLVPTGKTVVLGGLRKKDVSKQLNKIPYLGDIPVVGNLFKFVGENTQINELVIFITPRIMPQDIDLSPGEQDALDLTVFPGPKADDTRAEKKAQG
jgi:type IV pilus assembly protein PilQ